jgi:hypothetical protein
VKMHVECLANCELYKILQSSMPKLDSSKPSHNSTISIRCVGCMKHGPKKKVSCTIEPLNYATFYVPLRITDSKDGIMADDVTVTNDDLAEVEKSLGKRQPSSDDDSIEPMSYDRCQAAIDKHANIDYLSVGVLLELKKHKQPIVWSKDDLSYEIPRHVVEKYKGYKCACGTLCAFSCVRCYLEGGVHSTCLKKRTDSSDFTLSCLACHEKLNSKRRNKKMKVIDHSDDEPKSHMKEQKSKSILLRSAPNALVQILSGAVNSALGKRLSSEVLK